MSSKNRNKAGTTTPAPQSNTGEQMSNQETTTTQAPTDGSEVVVKDQQTITGADAGDMNAVLNPEGGTDNQGEGSDAKSEDGTEIVPMEQLGDVVTTQPPEDNTVVTTQAPEDNQVVTTLPPEDNSNDTDINKDGVQLGVFANRVAWIAENGSQHEKHVLTVMQNYVAVCSTSVDLAKIAVEQQRLWRLFEYIHNQPQEFKKLFTIIVEFGKEYEESVFSLAKLFRAQSALTLAADKLEAFNNLRTLVLNTIQSSDRKKVKALIDIRKIVENNVIPEHIRQGYVSFYS